MDSAWIQVGAGILTPYTIAGFVDFFFKERTKRRVYAEGGKWSDVPAYLKHEHGWHWWITLSWVVPQLAAVLLMNWPWQILFGPLIFYTEDLVYYILTFFVYGGTYDTRRFLPDHVPWLHGGLSFYARLVGDRFPRRTFLIVYALQWMLLTVCLILWPAG
jgi:hypothetical protein